MPVMTVRRRPTTQRALRWTGENVNEASDFLGNDFAGWHDTPDGRMLLVRTMEHSSEPFEAPPGSVLMEGSIHGEHWVVASHVFTETYRTPGPVRRALTWLGGRWPW